MTDPQNAARSYAKKRLALVLLGGVVGVTVGLAGIYGIGRLMGNAGTDPACKSAVETAHRMDTVVLDKTGTITAGKPALTDFVQRSQEIVHRSAPR